MSKSPEKSESFLAILAGTKRGSIFDRRGSNLSRRASKFSRRSSIYSNGAKSIKSDSSLTSIKSIELMDQINEDDEHNGERNLETPLHDISKNQKEVVKKRPDILVKRFTTKKDLVKAISPIKLPEEDKIEENVNEEATPLIKPKEQSRNKFKGLHKIIQTKYLESFATRPKRPIVPPSELSDIKLSSIKKTSKELNSISQTRNEILFTIKSDLALKKKTKHTKKLYSNNHDLRLLISKFF